MSGIGLVLAGGGGKGAYEIGVWKALDEFGITSNIQAVSGTSVGALNSALFAQGDWEQAERMWKSISPDAVMTLNSIPAYQTLVSALSGVLFGTRFFSIAQSLYQWIKRRSADQGVLSKEGLSRLIDDAFQFESIKTFRGPVYVAAYNISSMKLMYFDLRQTKTFDEVKDQLLASASIPVVFGKTYISGELYWDGGIPVIGDNVPVKPLYEDGYRNLIVVHLSREEPVDRKQFPDCHIIEIMPQEDLGGVISGTLNFKPECASENILRGYCDTVRVLEPIYKTGVALSRMEQALHSIIQEQRQFTNQNQVINKQLMTSTRELDVILDELSKGG